MSIPWVAEPSFTKLAATKQAAGPGGERRRPFFEPVSTHHMVG